MISTQALQHEVQRAEMLTEIQMMKTSEAMANSRAYEAEYAEAKMALVMARSEQEAAEASE